MKITGIIFNRRPAKEFLGIVLVIGACCNYMPLLGEYLDNMKTKPALSDIGQNQYIIANESQNWSIFKSAYFTIYYLPQDDLKSIERKLRTRILTSFGRNSYPDNVRSPSEKIAYRLDMLFIRTRELLDMYPDMRMNIKIFKNKKELHDEYYRIYKRRRGLPSFYVNKDKTIYACEDDISDSTMVQEMARAIVDQDLGLVLPVRVKDIFSSYVNSHLDE